MNKQLTGVTPEIARVKRTYDALERDLREDFVDPGMLFTSRTAAYFAPTMRAVCQEWVEMRTLIDATTSAGCQFTLTKAIQLAFMVGIVYGAETVGYSPDAPTAHSDEGNSG